MNKESSLRKIKYAVYFLICTLMILTSCDSNTSTADNNGILNYDMVFLNNMFFSNNFNAPRIAYDSYTNVIYYYDNNGYMCPYYSENGKLCRYIDGQIVEIEQENKSED